MAHLPLWLQPHTVTVEPYQGTSGAGHKYGSAVQVRCMFDGKTKLTIGADGAQSLSAGSLFTNLANESLVPVGSRVAGRTVQQVARHDDGGLGAWQHLEITLV